MRHAIETAAALVQHLGRALCHQSMGPVAVALIASVAITQRLDAASIGLLALAALGGWLLAILALAGVVLVLGAVAKRLTNLDAATQDDEIEAEPDSSEEK